MAVNNVHISPVTPDQLASGRYGSPEERARRERHARQETQDEDSDRLEISSSARETYRLNRFGPDLDFARKALDKTAPIPDSRLTQIMDRIESGYYRLPSVFWKVITRVIPSLR